MFNETSEAQRTVHAPTKKPKKPSQHTERFLNEMHGSFVARLTTPGPQTQSGRNDMGADLDIWDEDWKNMGTQASQEGTAA